MDVEHDPVPDGSEGRIIGHLTRESGGQVSTSQEDADGGREARSGVSHFERRL